MIKVKRFFLRNGREIMLFFIMLIIATLVQIKTAGNFFTSQNLYDLLREASILVIVSLGMMVVILTRGIDLSIGSIMGLSGMLGALALQADKNIPLILLFIFSISVGAICGLINGFCVSILRIYPLIVTLATEYIFRGTIYLFSHGAWVPQADMTEGFIAITTTNFLGINSLVWLAIIISFIFMFFFRFTQTGRYIYAVGNSEAAAVTTGISIVKIKTIAYLLCGIISGLAGLLWVCKYGNAQSESCKGYEISVIAAVVMGGCNISGGVGTVIGVVEGALIISMLNNILPLIQVSTYWQMAIRGFIIIVSVIINAITQRRMHETTLKRRIF
jgi:rhamnose transport system permease protein